MKETRLKRLLLWFWGKYQLKRQKADQSFWGGRWHPCLAAESGGKFGSDKNILMGLCLWLYDWIHWLKLSKKVAGGPGFKGRISEFSLRHTEFEGPIRWWSGDMCIRAYSWSSGLGYKYKFESHQKIVVYSHEIWWDELGREREEREGKCECSVQYTFPLGPKMAAEFQLLCLLSMQKEGGRAKCSCHLILRPFSRAPNDF